MVDALRFIVAVVAMLVQGLATGAPDGSSPAYVSPPEPVPTLSGAPSSHTPPPATPTAVVAFDPSVGVCAAPNWGDDIERAFFDAFSARHGCAAGAWAVRMIRCEGWNATANWDVAHISPTGDAGPAQINQIHGRRGGIIEGRWPSAVQNVTGNIAAALVLFDESGTRPWVNSQHCWG